jgi:hypothetical protein
MKESALPTKSRGFWAGLVVVALTCGVLFPVPLFAITFLTDWTIYQAAGGDAPPPFSVNVDFPFNGGQGNYFFYTPGDFRDETLGNSALFATRTFRVNPGGETLFLYQTFGVFLQNAALSQGLLVTPLTGGTSVDPFFTLASANAQRMFVDGTQYSFTPVVAGDYQLSIGVRLEKSRFGTVGGWQTASPFQFLVLGL